MSFTVERLTAEVDADPSKAIAALEAFNVAVSRVAKDETKHIQVDVDQDSLHTLNSVLSDMGSAVSGAADSLPSLTDGLSQVTDAGGGASGGLKAVADSAGGAGSGIMGLASSVGGFLITGTAFLAILSVLPGALAAAAAAAGALVAALAPLVGLLGAIPVGLGMLGGALGAVTLGMSGVTQGISAMQNVAKQTNMNQVADQAHQVAMAMQALQDAQHGAAESLKALKKAQDDYAKAPAEAAKALRDQRFAVREAVLREESAVQRLKQAQENLQKVQEAGAKSSYVLTKATDYFSGKQAEVARMSVDATDNTNNETDSKLALKQAELDLAEARANSKDQTKKLNDMERKGIKNSDIVVAARDRLKNAQYAYKKSLQAVQNAEYNVAKARKGTTAATNALTQAMKALSPAGKEFVDFMVHRFIPAWNDMKKAIQGELLPGVQSGLEAFLNRSMDDTKTALSNFAHTIGERFKDDMRFWTSSKNGRNQQLVSMFDGLNKTLDHTLKLARPLSRIIVAITQAATPMVNTLVDGLLGGLRHLADWMESDSGKKKMTKFFNDAAKFTKLWWNVLRPIGGIFKGIATAAKPLATTLLKDMAGYFGDLSKKVNSKEGQRNLRKWFHDQLPALREIGKILRDLGDLLFNSTKGGKKSSFYQALHEFRTETIPAIKDFLTYLDQTHFAADLLATLTKAVQLTDWLARHAAPPTKPKGPSGAAAHDPSARGSALTKQAKDAKNAKKDDLFLGMFDKHPIREFNKELDQIKKDWQTWGSAINYWWNVKLGGWSGILRGDWQKHDPWHELNMDAKISKPFRDWYLKVKHSFKVDFVDPIRRWIGDVGDSFQTDFLDKFVEMGSAIKKQFGKIVDSFKQDFLAPIIDAFNSFKISTPKIDKGPIHIPAFEWSPNLDNPFRQFGGPVEKNKPYIVGEKRPEVFVPSTSGRIMPNAMPRSSMESKAAGVTEEQLERILTKVLEGQRDVHVEQTFNEKVDPKHVAHEVAWSLR